MDLMRCPMKRATCLSEYLWVDFQMQLAHAWDDGFFALSVIMHSKRRVFSGKTVDSFREFIQVVLFSRTRGINNKREWQRGGFKTRVIIKGTSFRLNEYFYLVGWLHRHGNDRFRDVNGLLWVLKIYIKWRCFSWGTKAGFFVFRVSFASYHGQVSSCLGCESVSAGTVDSKQGTDISRINLIHILSKQRESTKSRMIVFKNDDRND